MVSSMIQSGCQNMHFRLMVNKFNNYLFLLANKIKFIAHSQILSDKVSDNLDYTKLTLDILHKTIYN